MGAGSAKFLGAAGLMAGLTFVSRLLGLVREAMLSYYFGTSELLSAFRIAFQAPNLARRLFGEGALSSAMVPVLTRTLRERGEHESRKLVGSTLTAATVILLLLLLGIELIIAVWRLIHDDPALRLTAIMMPYMVLICIAAVASGVLNVRDRFAVPAAAPTILNVAMILAMMLGGAVGLGTMALMDGLCISVLLAGVVQVAATGVALHLAGFFPIWGKAWSDPQLRAIAALMAPMTIGLSAVQINTLLDSVIAYLFVFDANGERIGTAVLGYAQFLYQLPLGVFGISLATALFPLMARKAAEGDRTGMVEVFERGVRMGQFIALPSAIGLIFIATPLVSTLYEHGGEFGAESTRRVASALVFYSLGIPAYFFQHVLIRTYYALHDSRTPATISVCMVVFNLCMNLMLVFVMEEQGLALSTSISATIQAIWLAAGLGSRLPELSLRRLGPALLSLGSAALCMAIALFLVTEFGEMMHWHNAVRLVALLVTGVGTYFAAAWILRVDELRVIKRPPLRRGAEGDQGGSPKGGA